MRDVKANLSEFEWYRVRKLGKRVVREDTEDGRVCVVEAYFLDGKWYVTEITYREVS